MISETEYDRLMTLWELREQSSRKDGSYTDRVVEMLEVASRDIWDAYGDPVMEYDEKSLPDAPGGGADRCGELASGAGSHC